MNDKAALTKCYRLAIGILRLSTGSIALIPSAERTHSPPLIQTFFLPSSMDNEEAKDPTAETGNVFTRIFTSCTSFVRSVTKGESAGASPQRKQADPKASVRRSSSKGKNKLQKPFQHSHSKPYTQLGRKQQSSTIPSSKLYQAIEDGSFWSIPDEEVNTLLILIRDEFPAELNRLKNAYSFRTTGIPRPSTESMSQFLYGHDYDEINRTLTGVLALRWIWSDMYTTFIGSQSPSPVVLKPESFDWMRQIFTTSLQEPIDIYTLVLSMIINDLGKDHNLATDYAKLKKIDISKVNHDMILLHAVEAGMVPALDRLPPQQRAQLITGIKLGAEFNFGQLAQGENAPASLSGLLVMRGEERAFEMRFMEQILDLSGASGHEDWTCAKKMIEPIFQSYRNVYDVAKGIISGNVNLRDGYDIILVRKLELLRRAGWEGELDIKKKNDRALARLFCMGNTNSKDTANIYAEAFHDAIDDETRNALVYGLNVDGSVDEPAVQPTYSPAMLGKASNNTRNGTKEEKVRAIATVLGYLARCFDVSDEEKARFRAEKVTVIERDIRVIDKTVGGEEFKMDCQAALRECKVPEAVAANTERG
jgi:hypothetical protein